MEMSSFLVLSWLISLGFGKPSAHPGLSIVTTSIGGAGPHLIPKNADYSRKVSVSVGSILNQQEAAVAAAKSSTDRPHGTVGTRSVSAYDDPTALRLHTSMLNAYPSRIDISSFHGEKINSAAISYLQPDLSRGTVAKLRVILGADYDDAWMSVEPRPPGNETTGYPPSSSKQSLIRQAEAINFSVFDDISGAKHQEIALSEKESAVLRKWLVQRADCPVQYVWRDNGNRYWPRWIRHAVCKEAVVCSWPPGMQCKPSGTKTLTLLRWYCTKQTPEEVQKRARRNYLRRARSLYNQAGGPYSIHSKGGLRKPEGVRRRFTREERRTKRVKRLVRQLSRSFREYYCEWHRDIYTLQPECSCMC
ncbi:unnamed protein product [Taenia asiatica]|uniref:Noggin n=1 Tax=Taenia asiatica TaxID=60517 RepID=A0A0R3VU46_TAEAS|nr:unnamed protein product [Taenia asiatica]